MTRGFALYLLMCCGLALAETPTPTSVYLVALSRSDVLGEWGDYVLDLRPADDEVLVRSVRVGPPNTFCSAPIIVKAHERRIKRKVYEGFFAKANPCDVNPRSVQRAMRTRGEVDLMEHPTDVRLVARCGGETRVLDLPYLAQGKKPRNSKVSKLRDLYWDIHQRVFPADITFRPTDLDDDYKLQEAAQQVASEMRAGEFDYVWINGESGGWKYAMDGYEGPIRTERLMAPSLLTTELNFISYAAPDYPPLAVSARIQGTVRLALNFALDGTVMEAHVVEGHAMLAPAVMKAARSWRVDPTSVPSIPTEVVIAFEPKCRH